MELADAATATPAPNDRQDQHSYQQHYDHQQQQAQDVAAKRRSSLPMLRTNTVRLHANRNGGFTPPDTPNSAEPTEDQGAGSEPLFHNYLRAFHPFEPSLDDEASSITVPIKQGDLILVHSVHANGWADGTLLTTGARGWLPTNYCEAYDHPYMRNLLNAMTQFWDLLGDSENASFSSFVRQDYVRGLIAGVRYLLEHTDCLHRGAELVLNHVGVRRMRKGLLADLSSMVQKAKELQEEASQPYAGEVIHIVLDELITKAFKVVTRAVRFVDTWTQEAVSVVDEASANAATAVASVAPPPTAEPPTPPVDTAETDFAEEPATPHSPSKRMSIAAAVTTNSKRESRPPSSSGSAHQQASPHHRRKSQHFSRHSVSSHRISLVRESRADGQMASAQLAQAHDECISLLGQFLGHHMQSRSPAGILDNTQRLVAACQRLTHIMDQVTPRSQGRAVSMNSSQLVFQTELDALTKSTKEVFTFSDSPDDEAIVLPDQIQRLVANGTRLVRAVGECVANTRRQLEKIGDFEVIADGSVFTLPAASSQVQHDLALSPVDETITKALPMPPPTAATAMRPRALTTGAMSPTMTEIATPDTPALYNAHVSMPPPTKYHRPLSRQPISPAITDPASVEPVSTSRKGSITNSMTDASTTVASVSRDSGTTAASITSTRATTPDRQPDHAELKAIDQRLLTSFGSVSSMTSQATDHDDPEGALLHKTYAHELVLNPQGQVMRGSLPALIEQLTAHDSTPDATFAASFYLTFRLFTNARALALAMIDRFDYIGDSKTVGYPVRLRICNFFKGWLENYWNADLDRDALGEVRYFAMHKVKPCLPSAAERLLELTRKVTAAYQSGASSPIGVSKFSTVSDETPAPEPAVSRAQLSTLQRANSSTGECSIVDLDPLEVARQLTIMASRAFCAIQPDELLSLAWTKKDSTKAVHVRALSKLNTQLNSMVSDTVLGQEEAKKRATVIKQWVKIAAACLTLQNYESLYAILAALMCSHIARMKKTWEVVSKKTKLRFEELKAVIDASGNNASLRRRHDETMAPCVPFLAICLGDLTFMDAGNPATRTLPNSSSATGEPITLINFTKYSQMAKVVTLVRRLQVQYSLQLLPELQTWLETNLTGMPDNQEEMERNFTSRSLVLEPRAHTLHPGRTQTQESVMRLAAVEERPKTAMADEKKPEFAIKELGFFAKAGGFGFKAALGKFEPQQNNNNNNNTTTHALATNGDAVEGAEK